MSKSVTNENVENLALFKFTPNFGNGIGYMEQSWVRGKIKAITMPLDVELSLQLLR